MASDEIQKASLGHQPPDAPGGAPSARCAVTTRFRVLAGLLAYHLTSWMLSHPAPLRLLFAVLRRLRPITILGGTVIVANGAYARDVLQRFEDFTLGEVLSPRMPWGPFLLTVDWRDQHDRERALLESMVAPGPDIEKIAKLSADQCEEAFKIAPVNFAGRREIDVVRAVCEPVVVRLAAEYFGIPVINRDEQRMVEVLRQIAGIAMVYPPECSARGRAAKSAIDELTRHITDTIAARAQGVTAAKLAPAVPGDTLLVRLVLAARATDKPAWLNDDFVRRYVTGLAATGGATIVRASANGLGELLKRPDALRRAREAVDALERAMRDEVRIGRDPASLPEQRTRAARLLAQRRDEFRQIVYEAMRFRPMLPLLLRYTPRDTLLAKGTRHQRRIKAGSSVIAGPLAVMFDPREFEAPHLFLSSRPLEKFVHFGFGPRTCFGKYVADTAMLEIFRAVVKLPRVKLGAGSSGRVAYDGPVADSLTVTYAAVTKSEGEEI